MGPNLNCFFSKSRSSEIEYVLSLAYWVRLRRLLPSAVASSVSGQLGSMDKGKKYVIFEGRKPGIYNSWEDASRQVLGHPGNVHRKASNPSEAERSLERFQASNNGKGEALSTPKKESHWHYC